jgi:diaminopimelate epimerase
MLISFTKAHGLGNDFIIIDELYKREIQIPEDEKPDFTRKICDRKHSIGADGVLFLQRSKESDFIMSPFNPDGSKPEICLNGLRCSTFVYSKKHPHGSKVTIETPAGKIYARVVKKPSLNLADVEVQIPGRREYKEKDVLKINDKKFIYHLINVGNPHAVIFLDEPVEKFPVEEIGHQIEYHPKFQPDRTNTEFVNVVRKNYLKMRVHERGACETQSCGSGSVAAVIAACGLNFCDKYEWVTVKQPGGELKIKYGKELYLRGPAEISFYGTINY